MERIDQGVSKKNGKSFFKYATWLFEQGHSYSEKLKVSEENQEATQQETEESFLRSSIVHYFDFLRISSFSNMKNEQVIACVRLMKLIFLCHSYAFAEIERGLKNQSSFVAWQSVLPQLFSRLASNDSILNQIISEILKRIIHSLSVFFF